MGTLGIFHWLILLIVWFLLFALPTMQIIHKAGYSRAWVLISFVPLLNFVFFYIFAFSRWPVEDGIAGK